MKEKTVINGPVYDARTLGKPRMMVLGLQHMFAMFAVILNKRTESAHHITISSVTENGAERQTTQCASQPQKWIKKRFVT